MKLKFNDFNYVYYSCAYKGTNKYLTNYLITSIPPRPVFILCQINFGPKTFTMNKSKLLTAYLANNVIDVFA